MGNLLMEKDWLTDPKTIQRLLETNLQKMRHKLRFMGNTSAKQIKMDEIKL